MPRLLGFILRGLTKTLQDGSLRNKATESASQCQSGTLGASKLLTLSPELRNQIWALVVEREETIAIVDLFSARPPEDALLRVSRQVYLETAGFYKAACKRYFRYFFVLSLNTPTSKAELKAFRSRLAKLSDRDIRDIKHLMILGLCDRLATESFIFFHGAWRGISILPSRPRPPTAGVFITQTERKVIRLPAGGWILPRVFKGHRGKPAFTFLEVHGGASLVMETREAVGWDGLTKDEILGAVKWFQEWR